MKTKKYYGEQNTEQWHQLRLGLFTASEIYRLFVEPKTKKAKEEGQWSDTAYKYIKEKACEVIYQDREEIRQNDAMIWGHENEPLASEWFESKTLEFVDKGEKKIQFVSVGKYAGLSPDDTIEGFVPSEYKCPKSRLVHLDHLSILNAEDLKKFSKQKFYQVHFQIWGLGAEFGYWSSFDPRLLNNEETIHKAIHTIKIERCEEICKQFEMKVEKAGVSRDEFIENILK